MKESKIQSETLALLAKFGYLAIPIEYRNTRGCPDLMVFAKYHPGMVAFIELKTPTGKIKPHQIDNAKVFRIWGHDVGFCRTPEDALLHCNKVFYGEEEKETRSEKEAPVRCDGTQKRAANHNKSLST